MTPEVASRYLARLGLHAPPPPTRAALAELMDRHLMAIPFENLDIAAGRPIVLGTRHALDKLIERRQGGFCYELNEAFGALLAHLGFAVRRIEARVWVARNQAFGAPFDHLALVVSLAEGEVLVDVGFGDGSRQPMRIPDGETADISGHYRLKTAEPGKLLLERFGRRPDGAAEPLYELTLGAQKLPAFGAMCRHHQTSPDSIFTRGVICSRATPGGRVTIAGTRLITVEGDSRQEIPIADGELAAALQTHFGIEWAPPAASTSP